MSIKKFNEFHSINESFRDDKKGMSLDDMMNHESSYKDRVACCLTDILTNERGISEKAFSAYDEVMKEVETFYESNKEELDDLLNLFETNDWRKEYCAEKIYADYFKNEINESKRKKKKSFENVAKPEDLVSKMQGVSLGKDKDGYFVYTHRARCSSYPTPHKIPASKIKFIESTG
jgi:hypothetical protein